LDLLFIILNSADVALAFNVLYDSAAGCLNDNNSDDVSPRNLSLQVQILMVDAIFCESL